MRGDSRSLSTNASHRIAANSPVVVTELLLDLTNTLFYQMSRFRAYVFFYGIYVFWLSFLKVPALFGLFRLVRTYNKRRLAIHNLHTPSCSMPYSLWSWKSICHWPKNTIKIDSIISMRSFVEIYTIWPVIRCTVVIITIFSVPKDYSLWTLRNYVHILV